MYALYVYTHTDMICCMHMMCVFVAYVKCTVSSDEYLQNTSGLAVQMASVAEFLAGASICQRDVVG